MCGCVDVCMCVCVCVCMCLSECARRCACMPCFFVRAQAQELLLQSVSSSSLRWDVSATRDAAFGLVDSFGRALPGRGVAALVLAQVRTRLDVQ